LDTGTSINLKNELLFTLVICVHEFATDFVVGSAVGSAINSAIDGGASPWFSQRYIKFEV
jgi:hypothetical protein